MSLKALLTVDLEGGVTETLRDKFYDELEKLKWSKVNNLTTTWTKEYSQLFHSEDVKNRIEYEVSQSAAAASITKYHYAAQCGMENLLIK